MTWNQRLGPVASLKLRKVPLMEFNYCCVAYLLNIRAGKNRISIIYKVRKKGKQPRKDLSVSLINIAEQPKRCKATLQLLLRETRYLYGSSWASLTVYESSAMICFVNLTYNFLNMCACLWCVRSTSSFINHKIQSFSNFLFQLHLYYWS